MSDAMIKKSIPALAFRRFGSLSLVIGMAVLAASCETIQGAESAMQVDSAEARVTMDRFVEKPGPTIQADTVRSVEGIWLGGKSVRATKGDPLPKSTEMVTLISAEPLGLQDIATEITTLTGVPVVLDIGDVDTAAAVPAAATANPNGGGFGVSGTGQLVEPSGDSIQLSYSGPLGGLLDLLSTRFGISWEYRNGSLRFLTQDTRVFTIFSFSGTTKLDSSLSNNSSGSGEGFGLSARQTASRTLDSGPFTEIVDQVTAMVTDGTVTASPASATITVTARPFVLDKVADFIDDQNERMTRQIALQIQVLSISRDQNDDFNFNLETVFSPDKYNFSTRPAAPVAAALSNTSIGSIAGQIVDTSSNWNGSQAIVQALADETKSSLVNSTNLITTNGVPVPFQIVRQTRFIAETQTTTDTAVSTTTATVEDLVTGFSVQLTPRIIADGGIMVSYSLALTELINLLPATTGTGTSSDSITIPTIDIKSVIQQAVLKNNETLVLSGFEEAKNKTTKNGLGLPENVALGGSQTGEIGRTITLVLITPKIIDARSLLRGDQL
jgi:type IVB pilus formation R64 PilN family outer membrane protein